jgi:hypothetical protein
LFIEKLRPDVDRLRHSNEFGVKIYNRLIKQYPQLCPDSHKGGKAGYGSGKKLGKDPNKVNKNPNKIKPKKKEKIK